MIACRCRTGILIGLLLTGSAPLAGQTVAGADASLMSRNVWRGLTYTNRPVLQPDLFLAIPRGRMTWTAGGWSNIELGRYDGSGDLSQGGGRASPDVTEIDWWLEGTRRFGSAALTGGLAGYDYPNPSGMTSSDNTLELYARGALAGPLNPRLSLFWDVDAYQGLYVEIGLSHRVPLSPRLGLDLAARVGAATGLDPTPGGRSRYAGNGLTHLDFSASTSVAAGGIVWTPVVHLVVASDPRVRITGPGEGHDLKAWFGLRAAWTHVFTGARPRR